MEDPDLSALKCVHCGTEFGISRGSYICPKCGGLFEVIHKAEEFTPDPGFRGVWKYRQLIHPSISRETIVTRGEGDTHLYKSEKVSDWAGIKPLWLKHEGENPTGSFKDRGMTVAISEAKRMGMQNTICASTGNTSASAASYSAIAGMKSYVLIPFGNVSESKLAQAVSYGAEIIDVKGDFDSAMSFISSMAESNNRYYVLNSINPWRLEGQKSITFEIMRDLQDCDFISLPAGNLGNTSAAGKALRELKKLGIIDRIPRIVSVQAEGASPFYNLWSGKDSKLVPVKAKTIASAIRIGNPVNWEKALISIKYTNGIVTTVSDDEIIEAKHTIDRSGIGCEPASAASVAGIRKLVGEGIIDKTDSVACVLTGNILKDLISIPTESIHQSVATFINEITGNN